MFKMFNKNKLKVQKTETNTKFVIQINIVKYIINTTEKHTLHKYLSTLKIYN